MQLVYKAVRVTGHVRPVSMSLIWPHMLQVMEEGEKLSKKQLTQETTIRKLRAQIREFEAEQSKVTRQHVLMARLMLTCPARKAVSQQQQHVAIRQTSCMCKVPIWMLDAGYTEAPSAPADMHSWPPSATGKAMTCAGIHNKSCSI